MIKNVWTRAGYNRFFVLSFDHNIFTLLIHILVSVRNFQEMDVGCSVSKFIDQELFVH